MEQESGNKQYISIIRFLEHIGASSNDWLDVSRLKKLANAEFNIAADGFIEVDGFSYSKEDVLKELDAPNWPTRLQMHQKVYGCNAVLNLLERNKANWAGLANDFKTLTGDTEFDQFFSPYFATAFNNVSRICINRNLFVEHADLLQYRDFVLPQHQEQAFKSLRLFLEEQIRVLRNISKENYSIMRPKMEMWLKPGWHQLLNNLPDDFFVYKDDFVHLFINLCVALQFTNKPDCIKLSTELIGLQGVNPEHKSIIESNHSIFIGSRSSSKSSSSKSGSGGSAIWWIVWIVFMIIRLVSNDSCKEKKSNYESPYKYTPSSNSNYYQSTDTNIGSVQDDGNVVKDEAVSEKANSYDDVKVSTKKKNPVPKYDNKTQQQKMDSIIKVLLEREKKRNQ